MPAETATAPPPTATTASPGPNMSEAFAGFDTLVAAPSEDKGSAGTPPAVSGAPPETSSDKINSPDTPTPPAEPKPPVDEKPSSTLNPPSSPKIKAATLREELDRTRSEAADWKIKYEKLAAESSKPKPDPEKESLLKSRDEWNKTRAELENELKFANYERSQEYKDKYQQPFLKAYEQGQKITAALTLKEPDKLDEFGVVAEPGKSRKGTEADWDALMNIQDEDAANKFIADHFGHNAARVTVLRDKVLDLHGQMRAAVEDFRKQGAERETKLHETLSQQQKAVSERWHAANAHAAEKYPQYFAPDPADPKGNELLAKGIRLTDLAFGVLDPSEFSKLPDNIQAKLVNGRLPPADLTLLHSAIRNRAAAYDRLIYKLAQAEAGNKERDEKLAGFEKSEPGRGQTRKVEPTTKPGVPSTLTDVDAAFDKLAAGNG